MSDLTTSDPKLTENPWFWVYLFGIAALIGLFLIGQKADNVQAQRDGNFVRRQQSLEVQAGHEAEIAAEEDMPRYVTFTPFYLVFGAITLGGWVMLWRSHFARRRAAAAARSS